MFGKTAADKTKLLAGTDIDERLINDPASDLTLFSFVTFSENLTRTIGPEWPLDALTIWASAMQGALEVAVRSAPNVGEAVQALGRYGHVRGPHLDIAVKRNKKAVRLEIRSRVALSDHVRRALFEIAMLSTHAMLSPILADQMGRIAFHFSWSAPRYAARFASTVGGTVSYNKKECAVVVPAELCAITSPFADARLYMSALAELEQAARSINSEDVLLMRLAQLFKREHTRRLNQADAAKQLGLSQRTLVRRLADAGTSFRVLLDADLKQRARELIARQQMNRTEMAEALGFQDPTSFSRACRRWFKHSL
jgi:AraC-like DNA-binding protein